VIELVAADPDEHLDLVHGWMNEPHVAEWWDLARPREDVRAYLDELGHVKPWIASEDGVPFAYVETYRAAEDSLSRYYEARADDQGWHLLVGDPHFVGTGVPRSLGRLVVGRLRSGGRVVCEPDVRNARMLAYCRRIGGRQIATLDLPGKRAALIAWER
jgi:acetyl CoA:N6-hydroxylysine acetyl transferase